MEQAGPPQRDADASNPGPAQRHGISRCDSDTAGLLYRPTAESRTDSQG